MQPPQNVAFLERAIRHLAGTDEAANRQRQPWPIEIKPTDEWRAAYDGARAQLPVLPSVDEAAAWTNDLIAKIDAAK